MATINDLNTQWHKAINIILILTILIFEFLEKAMLEIAVLRGYWSLTDSVCVQLGTEPQFWSTPASNIKPFRLEGIQGKIFFQTEIVSFQRDGWKYTMMLLKANI